MGPEARAWLQRLVAKEAGGTRLQQPGDHPQAFTKRFCLTQIMQLKNDRGPAVAIDTDDQFLPVWFYIARAVDTAQQSYTPKQLLDALGQAEQQAAARSGSQSDSVTSEWEVSKLKPRHDVVPVLAPLMTPHLLARPLPTGSVLMSLLALQVSPCFCRFLSVSSRWFAFL